MFEIKDMPRYLFRIQQWQVMVNGFMILVMKTVCATHLVKLIKRRGNPLVNIALTVTAGWALTKYQRSKALIRRMHEEELAHVYEDPDRYLAALASFKSLIETVATYLCTECSRPPHRFFVSSLDHPEYSAVHGGIDPETGNYEFAYTFRDEETKYVTDASGVVHTIRTVLGLEYRHSPLSLNVTKQLVPYEVDAETGYATPVPIDDSVHEARSEKASPKEFRFFGYAMQFYRPGQGMGVAECVTIQELEEAVAILEQISTYVTAS